MNDNRALIVDDSRTACLMLSRALKRYGVESDHQHSGMEALEYLKHSRPSVIFMDQNMPGMDGVEVVKLLKESNSTAAIPVFMYTSHADDLFLARAKAAGAVDTLSKEFENEHIENILYRINLLTPQNDTQINPPVELVSAEKASPAPAMPDTSSTTDREELIAIVTEVLDKKLQAFYDSNFQSYWNEIWSANYDQRDYYNARLDDFCQSVVQPYVAQQLAQTMVAEAKQIAGKHQELKTELNDYMGRKNREIHELKEQLENQKKQFSTSVYVFGVILVGLAISQWIW